MGYLFLGISLISGAVKGYCGKKTSGYVNGYSSAVFANFIRMCLCIGIGLILTAVQKEYHGFSLNAGLLAISAIAGISTSVFVVCWLISVRKGAYMMLDVFLMLGVLVPICAGHFFFGEEIKATQWLGVFILVAAAFLMCSYNNSIKEKMTVSSFVMLLICGAANGTTDFMQKMFVKQLPDISISVFNVYTYVFSAAVLGIVFIFFRAEEKEHRILKACPV